MGWIEIAKSAVGIALRAIERHEQIKNGQIPTAGDIEAEKQRTQTLLKQLDDAANASTTSTQ